MKLFSSVSVNFSVCRKLITVIYSLFDNFSLDFRNQYGIERKTSKDNIAAELQTPDTGIIIPEVIFLICSCSRPSFCI